MVNNQEPETAKRTRVPRPYPTDSLKEALVIARAINSEYAGRDTGILDIAQAVGRTSGSSALRSLITSSGKYGLTEGSYASPQISLTARGLAVVAPRDELESPKALIEAALEPAPFKEFYTKYDQNRLPQDAIALNVLERECGIPAAVSGECLELIKVNAYIEVDPISWTGLARN